ncbi:MAG: hypothetical protein ACREKH_19300, partial [Candidatus Rokuibacteriota bacterium]
LVSVHEYLAEYRGQPSDIRDAPSLTTVASLGSRLPNVPLPLPHPYVYALATGILYNATGGGHGPVYLLGELSQRGWWHYFFVAFALKTPLALFPLVVAAAALSPRWFRKNALDESALLVATVVLFAFFSFACTAQLGVRYLLPVLPFLFVAVGKAAAYTPRRHATAYRATLAALVLWFAISSLSFHPHYLSYFNELIGDRKNMYRYLADSNVDWAQSDEYLARYLAAPDRGPVAVNPEAPVTGRVVVNVNALVGITAPREKYAWLRDRFEPVDHVAYAWLVYEIPGR